MISLSWGVACNPYQTIQASEMKDMLDAKLAGTEFKLIRDSSSSEDAIKNARRETGWTVPDRTGGIMTWKRETS